ncbi:MAG: hypothetical protein HY074_00860 [Deltaproteobacteria bacterium]|nr:hypothetical protein [Deltaproteobacteria bacterium]
MRLYIKEAKKTQDWMPMSWIFSHSGLMCALAPEARVQFDGCNVACRDGVSNGAEDLLSQLNSLAGNSRYATPANATPFDKTRFLFNTSRGRAADSFRNFFLRKGWNYNIGIRDEENSAIMYSVKGNTVETDVPTANAALCPVEKP